MNHIFVSEKNDHFIIHNHCHSRIEKYRNGPSLSDHLPILAQSSMMAGHGYTIMYRICFSQSLLHTYLTLIVFFISDGLCCHILYYVSSISALIHEWLSTILFMTTGIWWLFLFNTTAKIHRWSPLISIVDQWCPTVSISAEALSYLVKTLFILQVSIAFFCYIFWSRSPDIGLRFDSRPVANLWHHYNVII